MTEFTLKLPYAKDLNIGALSRVFDSKTQSYKLFWFKAIMDCVSDGARVIPTAKLYSKMISTAWFMVSEYHLNLGPNDAIENIVKDPILQGKLKANAKELEIEAILSDNRDKNLEHQFNKLDRNVKMRLLSPFLTDFKGETTETWASTSKTVERINRDAGVIYHIIGTGKEGTIELNDDWFQYLYQNREIIYGWIYYNLIIYLQRRNPNVPGISDKLMPPETRKLKCAQNLWKAVVSITPIPNIYDKKGTILTASDISIDHFIPWSYVAHDELWNLIPTTRVNNSEKSNNLPKWDVYFQKFCNVEYQAYDVIKTNKSVHELFDKCKKDHINNDNVLLELYSKNLSAQQYANALERLIKPAYMAAKNMGFEEWQKIN